MVHNHQQFCQHPVHLLQSDKLRANNRPCLLDEFVQSVGVLQSDVCTPGHHSLDQCFPTFFSLKPPLPVSKTSQAPPTPTHIH